MPKGFDCLTYINKKDCGIFGKKRYFCHEFMILY